MCSAMHNKLSNWTTTLIVLMCLIAILPSYVDARRTSGGRRGGKGVGRSYSRGRQPQTAVVPPESSISLGQSSVSRSSALDLSRGPPPPYPGLGGKTASIQNAPPPPYAAVNGRPPSYAEATGGNYGPGYTYGHGGAPSTNIGKIPVRGQQPVLANTEFATFHGLGAGHQAYGGPSHMSNNAPQSPYHNSGTLGYGNTYGYGSQLPNTFSFGNVLTGLALWNVARGFNRYDHRSSERQHVDKIDAKPIVPTVNATAMPFILNQPDTTGVEQTMELDTRTSRPKMVSESAITSVQR